MSFEKMIDDIEKEIDANFQDNQLMNIDYDEAMYALLTAIEKEFQENEHKTEPKPSPDLIFNAVSRTVKLIHKAKDKTKEANRMSKREMEKAARNWIKKSYDYDQACSIFPMYRTNRVKLAIFENTVFPVCRQNHDFCYEAYNRIGYDQRSMFSLPDNWKTTKFSFGDFKKVFCYIYSVSLYLIEQSKKDRNFEKIWIEKLDNFNKKVSIDTSIKIGTVNSIIDYLTIGKYIQVADIAFQPLIQLANNKIALVPSIFRNSNAQRNLCVLLNKMEVERNLYTNQTNDKEDILIKHIEKQLNDFVFRFVKRKKLEGTDLDIAIISEKERCCLCIELKWFFEPAKIRRISKRHKTSRENYRLV